MRRTWPAALVLAVVMWTPPSRAASPPLSVGILPFDVVSVEGATEAIGRELAKLVRIEMIRNRQLRPLLVSMPEGIQLPLPPEKAAEVGRGVEADLVLVGTVIEATTSHSSHSASTGGLFGIGVGGSVTRTSANVSLHVELVDPSSGKVADTFEVESSSTDTGVGADFSTVLGSFGTGDRGWEKTPMGKALREGAQKITAEVARRGSKFAGRHPSSAPAAPLTPRAPAPEPSTTPAGQTPPAQVPVPTASAAASAPTSSASSTASSGGGVTLYPGAVRDEALSSGLSTASKSVEVAFTDDGLELVKSHYATVLGAQPQAAPRGQGVRLVSGSTQVELTPEAVDSAGKRWRTRIMVSQPTQGKEK